MAIAYCLPYTDRLFAVLDTNSPGAVDCVSKYCDASKQSSGRKLAELKVIYTAQSHPKVDWLSFADAFVTDFDYYSGKAAFPGAGSDPIGVGMLTSERLLSNLRGNGIDLSDF